MTVVCRQCTRVNPPEARYCYHDGVALPGQAHLAGPIAVGAQPFGHPFVFPSGRACHNFDELALACDAHWEEARELLRDGFLEGFLGNLGRADLARAARRAAREPDADCGLHDFLSQLPGDRRDPPSLVAHPLEINLGRLPRGTDRTFLLQIENNGSGLLQGTISSDSATAWLALGEGVGAHQKVFQCRRDQTIPVQVLGNALRAGNKPLEGQLLIESNGGSAIVLVRAEVPVRPFPDGVLADAVNPRQIAEKARANPREAAALFEQGAVTRWYESNGWTYPVQGPTSSGLGAVQQFFEALGLVTPPPVTISATSVRLEGAPGAKLDHTLQISTSAKRPVFAHASSTAPWLHVGRVQLKGQVGYIPLIVGPVPAAPGEHLRAKVHIVANGNQRFVVEVLLDVAGRPAARSTGRRAPVLEMADVLASPPPRPEVPHVAVADAPPPVRSSGARRTSPPGPVEADPADNPPPPGRGLPSYLNENGGAFTPERASPAPVAVLPVAEVAPTAQPYGDEEEHGPGVLARTLKHLSFLGVLLLALGGVVLHDFLLPRDEPTVDEDPGPALLDPIPRIALRFHDEPKDKEETFKPIPEASMRFGIVMLGEAGRQPEKFKKLMYDEWGRTNNTCLRVDGKDFLFGHLHHFFRGPFGGARPGPKLAHWVRMKEPLGKDETGRERLGARSTWALDASRVEVTQLVEIVPGDQSALLDTCRVRYTVTNKDDRPHQVGIRFLLDTFIGANDGVPFTIPGEKALCETKKRFDRPEDVPEYIQALERNDLLHPGTVAHLQLKLGGGLEAPGRVLLGGYPDGPLNRLGYREANAWLTLWDVPLMNMRELAERQGELRDRPRTPYPPDSAVTMYWDPLPLEPGGKREVGFSYGLGQVASGEGEGRLLLTVPNTIEQGSEFTLTALIKEPEPGETVKLVIPGNKFALVSGSPEQTVPPVPPGSSRPISPVSWRLKADHRGRFHVYVMSSTGVTQKQTLRVIPPRKFKGVLD
jgi:hypothetical protein